MSVAVAKMKSTERRLTKLGLQYSGLYNYQIQDMAERQVARKLSVEEINNYEGLVHYVHHHEVLKPDSSSTPLRIVFNSSASYKRLIGYSSQISSGKIWIYWRHL